MPTDSQLHSQPERLYLIIYVLPSRQLGGIGTISPHILVSLVCTGDNTPDEVCRRCPYPITTSSTIISTKPMAKPMVL